VKEEGTKNNSAHHQVQRKQDESCTIEGVTFPDVVGDSGRGQVKRARIRGRKGRREGGEFQNQALKGS